MANRFYRRWRGGILERVFAALLADGDARAALEWLLHYLDGTGVRAHQHAADRQTASTLPRSICKSIPAWIPADPWREQR